MNRQAVAFLSMFTLILMLSIYYVSLENEPVSVGTTYNDSESVARVMQENITLDKEEQIQKLKEILGSNQSEEAKNQALQQMNQLEEAKAKEKEIVEALQKMDIVSVVEIQGQVIKIRLAEQKETQENATMILNLVYPLVEENYTMELSFS